MNIFARHKHILLAVIGLTIIFFGYWYFVLSKNDSDSAQANTSGGALVKTSDAPAAQAAKGYDREFVAGLLSLNTINIDIEVFRSAAYQRLSFPEQPFAVDYNIPYGRQNPFLPIGMRGAGNLDDGSQPEQPVVVATTTATSPATSTATSTATSSPTPSPKPTPKR